MMRSLLEHLFRKGTGADRAVLSPRIDHHDTQPTAIYAIGDVHGRVDLLADLEEIILHDASGKQGDNWIVLLGDMVDRGPHSAQVLDHLVSDPPIGFSRQAIAGNHESMMLDFLDRPNGNAAWLKHGGMETLYSYGIPEDQLASVLTNRSRLRAVVESYIPDEHLALLRDMADGISFPNSLLIHRKEDLRRFLAEEPDNANEKWIVHGHTIVERPCKTDNRTVCVDTGAYYTDCLSAARISTDGSIKFLQSTAVRETKF